jgi:hypothetical protein
MSDENERSVASAGSHGEPVAWWVTLPGRDFPYLSHIQDRALFCQNEEPGSEVIPLYRSPTLTDEEREAIACAAESYADNDDDEDCARVAATLRGVIERLG